MTKDGLIIDPKKDNSKCHCGTKKKYKNCCLAEDIKGEYDRDINIFYCDIEDFKKRFFYEVKEKIENTNKINSSSAKMANGIEDIETNSLSKRLDKIFI